ncbi:hypothetical protein Tco_0681358 [Tanacetum coccineum]|uniref:Uncharacterized protein n=1 Tax=Tanacetum coccineum TaxID=301880 RepID=A0ABQ4XNG3_9ASTR
MKAEFKITLRLMKKTSPTLNALQFVVPTDDREGGLSYGEMYITSVMLTNGGKGNFPMLNESSRAKPRERIGILMEPNGDIRHHFQKGGQLKWLTPRVKGNEVGNSEEIA